MASRNNTPNPAGRPVQFAHRASFYKYVKAQVTRVLAARWRGSRASLKATLRRAMQPKRRDIGFLTGLLRATATPTVLAAVLFASAAHANPVCSLSFVERTGADNPFQNVLTGTDPISGDRMHASLGDWDADGDLDLLVSGSDFSFPPQSPPPQRRSQFYRNDGDRTNPAWTNITVNGDTYGAVGGLLGDLVDLDADGDLDIIDSRFTNTRYYENNGTAEAPVFLSNGGTVAPLAGVATSDYTGVDTADLDGDGDQDIVSGLETGGFRYYENTGDALAAGFAELTGASNPLNGVNAGTYPRHALGDIDGDGDFDLLAGNESGEVRFFENTGTATTPAFTEQTGAANPFDGVDAGSYASVAMADVDGDSDLDVLVGKQTTGFLYFENTSTKATPVYAEVTGASDPTNGINTPGYASPAWGDMDADGDLDLVIGDGTFIKSAAGAVKGGGTDIRYFENTGTADSAAFTQRTGGANPFTEDFFRDPVSADLGDLDADGDLDMLVGDTDNNILYRQNDGTALSPSLSVAASPISGAISTPYLTPAFVDIDADGDLDVFIGGFSGGIRYFENTGSALTAAMTQRTGAANPLNTAGNSGGHAPRFFDFDSDGDMDCLSGLNNGTLRYFENIGTPLVPEFVERTGVQHPFDGVDVGNKARPSFADIDADGLMEVVIGNEAGGIRYFEPSPDCTPPVAACQDITLDLDATGNAFLDASALDNGSSDNLSAVAFSAAPATFDCGDIGPNAVTLTVLDGGGLSDTCSATVMVRDVTPPTLTLVGDASIEVDCKGNYADPGAAAADACDSALPPVTVGGDMVDVTTPGDYTITYDVADASGNDAVQISRTVTVLDNCTTLRVETGTNEVNAVEGDEVTLEIEILDANGTVDLIQWFYDDGSKSPVALSDTGNIIGSNTDTLRLDPVGLGNTGTYFAEVSDEFDTVASSQIMLTVNAALSAVGGLGLSLLAGMLGLVGALRRR